LLHHALGVQQRDQLGRLGAAGGIVGAGGEGKAEDENEEQGETMRTETDGHDASILLCLKETTESDAAAWDVAGFAGEAEAGVSRRLLHVQAAPKVPRSRNVIVVF
jgi:hypothetical protein